MNAGIVTSFLVGGLLLFSILQMNFTVSNNANETTLQTMAKNKMQAVTETMTYDLERMGIGVDDPTTVISNASNSTQIIFTRVVSGSTQTFRWEFKDSSEYNASKNPDDSPLVRTAPDPSGGGTQTTTYAVVDFNISYLDISGNTISSPNDATGIRVSVTTQSPQGIQRTSNGSKFYGTSHWDHTIYPANLQF